MGPATPVVDRPYVAPLTRRTLSAIGDAFADVAQKLSDPNLPPAERQKLQQRYNQLNQLQQMLTAMYAQLQQAVMNLITNACHAMAPVEGEPTPVEGEPAPEVQDARVNLSLFPPGFMKHPVHLHHSHQTGMTIGAVFGRIAGREAALRARN